MVYLLSIYAMFQQLGTGPMVQWFTTSPLHGEDPEFEPRLDQVRDFFTLVQNFYSGIVLFIWCLNNF